VVGRPRFDLNIYRMLWFHCKMKVREMNKGSIKNTFLLCFTKLLGLKDLTGHVTANAASDTVVIL
jgi:hypothetical protein